MPNNNVIDRLSIEFEAEVTRVLSDTSKLLSALTNVANKVRELDGLKVSLGITKGTGEALERFARAVDSMDVNKFREFATATNYMAKINLGLNEKSGDNLLNFAAAVESMDVGKLYDLGVSTSTIQKLPNIIGAKSVENLVALGKAIDGFNVQKFGELSQVNAGFSKIPYLGVGEKTGTNLQHFSTALDSLNLEKMSAWSSVNEAFHPFSNMGIGDKTGKNLQSFSTALNSIDLGKLREFSDVNSAFQSITLGIGAKSGDNLANFALGLNQLDLNKLRELSQIDFTNMKVLSQASQNIRGLAVALNRLEKTSVLADKRQRSLGRSIASTGDHAKRSSNKLLNLFQTIKRIAFYRAIRSAMKAFVSGFAEGIENLYYWSQMVGTSFAPRMDQLATATQYLKNGFASMWSPLIEYAIPIIDNLIDRLVDMFNVVQELFARLTGAATWNKALKYPVTYKDALDDASGSAKALQNILMDFDEINAINTPKSGSRGSGADAKDYSAMFKLMETATGNPMAGFGKFFEDIAGKVETAYGIVNRFWQFFKGLNFAPFKKSLDDLWNNTLSPIIDDLLEDSDWFREKVLQPITKFLVEQGIPGIIDTLSVAVKSLWDAFKPLRDGLKLFWDENGEWIMKLVGGTFLGALQTIRDAFTRIGDAFKNNQSLQNIFENISLIAKSIGESQVFQTLFNMIKTSAFDSFLSSIENTLTAIEPILEIVSGILNIVGSLFKTQIKGEHKAYEGMKEIERGLFRLIYSPFTILLRTLADILDALGEFIPACKDAAHTIRVMIGDEIEEVDRKTQEVTRSTTKYYREVDAAGNYISYTGAKISAAQDEVNQQYALQIQKVKELGGEVATQSMNMTQWYNYCETNGLDPLTGKIIFAGQKEAELAYQAQVSSQNTANAWKIAGDQISATWKNVKIVAGGAFDGLPTANQNAINRIKEQTASLGQYIKNVLGVDVANFAPSAGYTIGSQLKVGIENGLRNLHLNIPATVNIVNTTGSTAAARVHGATFDMSMFANGGFLPSQYSLFAAGEGGVPEMLGTVGGRTAVAGGAEITGIREAIVEQGQREEGLLRSLISAVQNKDLSLVANSSTGRWVNKALKAYAGVSG